MARPRSCSSGLRSRPSSGAGDRAARTGSTWQDEQQEGGADPGPARPAHWRAASPADCAPNSGDQRAEERQDQHPEQHRAFVVAPDAGDLVDQRLRRMRVLPDVRDREIGAAHRPMASAAKDDRDQRKAASPPPARATAISLASPRARAEQRHASTAPATAQTPEPARNVRASTDHCRSPAALRTLPCQTPFAPSGCRRLPWACSSRHAWPARCRRQTRRPGRSCLR